jgi:hypothetical protein
MIFFANGANCIATRIDAQVGTIASVLRNESLHIDLGIATNRDFKRLSKVFLA